MGTIGGEIYLGFTCLIYIGRTSCNLPAWHNLKKTFYSRDAYPLFMYKIAQTCYPFDIILRI